MISAGVDGRLSYMTYPEPWRGPPKQPPAEFLRPAPKPLPSSRYNGIITTSSNGTRLAPPQRPLSKYAPQPNIITPVNLAQHKEDTTIDDLQQFNAYARLFPHNAHFAPFTPYPSLYPPYTHMMRQGSFPQTPLSPLETFSPATPTGTNSSTFLSPSYSPPSVLKCNQTINREKRTPPHTQTSQPPSPNQGSFKVPSGKEGSLKHRILIRPEDVPRSTNSGPLDLQKPAEVPRKRLLATMSPPRSPKKSQNNNSVVTASFAAGSLIQLASGELRKIEDMRTEDFISSAENNPELRLAESTVVKIEENRSIGNATITLSYNQRRTQIGVDSTTEHPFFIYGQGWASCNPEKTLQCYGLKVNKLQVGDILVSLTPRQPNNNIFERCSTIVTTATTTSMTARQISVGSSSNSNHPQTQPLNLHSSNAAPPRTLSPESLAARKRRWSAPDQISDEDLNTRRHRGE